MTWEQMSLFSDKELGVTPGIIGLAGYAQSGKDTLAKVLVEEHGYIRRAFADNIREILYDLNPFIGTEPLQVLVDAEGWDKAKTRHEVRRMLQVLGVSARKHLDDYIWVAAVLAKIDRDEKVVITDVRFKNEADIIRQLGGVVWRVERPGVGPVNKHVSESELNDYEFDQVIHNDGGIEDLHEMVSKLL